MRGREPSRKTSQREVGLCGSRLNPAAKLACRQDELLFRDPPLPRSQVFLLQACLPGCRPRLSLQRAARLPRP
jgi:hypothetical protein